MIGKVICPVCGGKLQIVLESGLAVCEACGKTFDADPKDVQKYGEIVRDAERAMRQNTAAGYRDAIRLLSSVPFVAGVPEKRAECQKLLSELQTKTLQRKEHSRLSEAKDTRLGVVLLILTALFVLAAIAGVVYLIVLWSKGMLPRKVILVIVVCVAIAVVLSVVGRLRREN